MKRLSLHLFRSILFFGLFAVPGSQAAKYAGDPFSLGVGGRSLALGGATIAGKFDGTAPYWNPAGMNQLDGRYLTAMHAETFGSLLNHDFVSYVNARPADSLSLIQSFGFYLYYLGGGGIKITELNEFDRPYVVREESHGDYLLAASASGKLRDNLDFGLTAKLIYRDIGTESGYGLTMDAGFLWQVRPDLSAGLTLTDFTTGFIRYSGKTFDSTAHTESIYPTVRPGLAYTRSWTDFETTLYASGDIKFEGIKEAAQFWSGPVSLDTHWGLELGYKEMLYGRTGFDIGRFTAGGGVAFRKLSLDLAYLHHDQLDETFRVSAGYRF